MSEIKSYILKNNLLEVSILNIGAVLHKVMYKGENRVLTYNDIEEYKTNPICLGAIVGRVAGRISGAKFKLNGVEYNLDNNESDYSIHGGFTNLTKKYWNVKEYNNHDINPYIILTSVLEDGDSGYPGRVEFTVKYILLSSTIRIEIMAKSDKDTLVNLTNHSYFNLNSDKKNSIKNHSLMINSDKILKAADNCVPIGIMDVEGTDFDLNKVRELSILDNLTHEQSIKFGGYDHAFLLNGKVPSVKLKNEEVGLEVTTSYPSVVVYSGNAISEKYKIGKTTSFNHQGICFEAQYEPDFINKDFLENHILKAGEDMIEYIEFKFI